MIASMTVAEYDPGEYQDAMVFFGPHQVVKIEPRAPVNDRPAFKLTRPNGDTFSVYATETIRVLIADRLGLVPHVKSEVQDVEVSQTQPEQSDL